MRLLITGASGFIGSNLCRYLLERGCEVIGLDNFITSPPENIRDCLANPRFTFYEHDIINPFYLAEGRLDWIVHLASPASPVDYLRFPIQTLKVGSIGTHNCLGIARKHHASFFLASTSEVYGDPLVHPQPEEYWGNVNSMGVRSVYDEAKRFAESITGAYYRVHAIPVRIARIFNTYGPQMRMSDGRVISNFICQALRHEPLTIYGDGSQTRSFCYVSDLVEGIYRLISSEYVLPLNLGNPEELSMRELAEKIIKLTGSKSTLVFQPSSQDDPRKRKPDIRKARTILKWQPQVSIDEGLQRTIEYFKIVLSREDGLI